MTGTTPVTNINGLEEFTINPNPVTSSAVLTVKLNTVKEIQFQILSADGKRIYQSVKQTQAGLQRTELNMIEELPAGFYLLQLRVNNETLSKQFVKQ